MKRGRGRPKLTWVEAIKGDLKGWNILKDIPFVFIKKCIGVVDK